MHALPGGFPSLTACSYREPTKIAEQVWPTHISEPLRTGIATVFFGVYQLDETTLLLRPLPLRLPIRRRDVFGRVCGKRRRLMTLGRSPLDARLYFARARGSLLPHHSQSGRFSCCQITDRRWTNRLHTRGMVVRLCFLPSWKHPLPVICYHILHTSMVALKQILASNLLLDFFARYLPNTRMCLPQNLLFGCLFQERCLYQIK